MTLADRLLLAGYEQIAVLDEDRGVTFVQHKNSKKVYVMKRLSVFNYEVYSYLKDNLVRGIPQIIEEIVDGDDLIIIEEYVSGRTVRSILDDGNLFSEKEAAGIIKQLCGILSVLHEREPAIVHRDIKPSNIIITYDGDVYLLDMNAAKFYNADKTEDTSLIGTAGYAAPEQYGFGSSGIRADIYAAGVLLNEMLTGKNSRDVIPGGRIGKVIRKCTMIDPEDRYSSVKELAAALGRISASPGDEVPAARNWLPPGFRSMDPSHMAMAVMGYILIVALGVTLRINNAPSDIYVWFERCGFIIVCLAGVLITNNYMDVWKKLKIDRLRGSVLKAAAVLAADAAAAVIMAVILSIIKTSL